MNIWRCINQVTVFKFLVYSVNNTRCPLLHVISLCMRPFGCEKSDKISKILRPYSEYHIDYYLRNSRVFLQRQLWIVNYYVKSLSNNLSNEHIKTGVSREMIFQK